MIRSVLAIGLILFAFSTRNGRGDQPANAIFPFPVHRTQLENGLTVISVEYDSPGIIAYYTVVRTGSRNEVEPGLSGFAHFFEHMMFRGTPRFSEGKYTEMLKGLGADSNAFTTDDWTCYHATMSAASLETIVDLESDRFQNLKYNEPEFQKEARAVLGEYNKSASSPFQLLDEKMQDTAFTKHTYKHTTIGFLKDIKDMPNQYQYSLKFFERWYRPENCIVLVVGDVEHKWLTELAKRHYGSWKRGSTKIEIPQEPPQTEERKLALTWNGPTLPYLYIGYHIPGFDAKNSDIAALDVLSSAVFSETSPLFRKLVLQERKAEFIQGGAPFRRDPSLFTIMARVTSEEHIDSVREEIYRELEKAAQTSIDPSRLENIKSHMRYEFAMGLDTPDAVAGTLSQFLQLTGDPDSVNQIYAAYDRVNADDVRRVASTYFKPTNRTAITLRAAASKPAEKKAATPANGGSCDSDVTGVPEPEAARSPAPISPAPISPAPISPAPISPAPISASPISAEPISAEPISNGSSEPVILAQAGNRKSDKTPAAAKEPAPTASDTILLNEKSPLVALRIAFRTGTKDDPPGKEGLAALTVRLLTEGGTKRYSYDEILERLYPMAASVSGHADKEVTVFSGDVHRDKLSDFYDLFGEMLTAPRFDSNDFERIKEEQLNLVSKVLRGNNDEALGKWTLQLALYPEHPYGHVDAGTVAGLKSITLDDVKAFYQGHFSPQSASVQLGVAGGANEAFVRKLRQDFGSKPAAVHKARELPAPHTPSGLEVTIVEKDCIATAISIGFPIQLTRADDDFYTLAVANSALGEHRTFNGRLMRNMRGLRGLNYGDYSYIENFIQDGGSTFPISNIPRQQQYFSIWIRPVPHDKALFALRQAIRELDVFVSDGLGEAEFQATRGFLHNYSKLWVQSQSRRLGYEMDGVFYGRASLVDELDRRLPSVTREQVNAVIKKYLQAKNLSIAIVTPDGEVFRDAMLAGKPSPLVYDTAGTPDSILAEDKRIEAYPLNINRDRVRIISSDAMFEK